MRTWAAVVCFLFLGALSVRAAENQPQQASTSQQPAQSQAPQAAGSEAAPAQTAIDPAKEADIRHLLDVSGASALMNQVMGAMEQSLRPVLANSFPPGEYRERLIDLFFEKFHSKLDSKRLLDLAVVRYDQYFSDEDIKGLLKFYETPLGQKAVSVLPKLTGELQQDGQKLGQQVGRESMIEVLSEHPDLAKALQEASRGLSPPPR